MKQNITHTSIDKDAIFTINEVQLIDNPEIYLERHVNLCVDHLLTIEIDNLVLIQNVHLQLLDLGSSVQHDFWQINDQLSHTLQRLMSEIQSDSQLIDLMADLQKKMKRLKPPMSKRFSLKEKFKLLFSWQQTAMEVWQEEYQDLRREFKVLVRQLEDNKHILREKNDVLAEDQKQMHQLVELLSAHVDYLNLLDKKLADQLQLVQIDHAEMMRDNFLSAVQQRLVELHQQLLIARQAEMTLSLVVKQNELLIRDIGQSLMNTAAALDTAANIASLKNKSKQLDLGQYLEQTECIDHALKNIQIEQSKQLIKETLEKIEAFGAEAKTSP